MSTAEVSIPLTSRAATGRLPYRIAKRTLDMTVAGVCVALLAPLFAVIALLIKFEDGGPVIFRQTRAGKGGRAFTFYKFRSMCANAEAQRNGLRRATRMHALRFKLVRDPRITRVGRFLRRFSLDELPQLFNVLVGDMSLVGPRPPLFEEVAHYTDHQARRLSIAQGLTCSWQVSGRSLLSFEQQVQLDLSYADERTLLGDLKLLVLTVPAVLLGKGAY